MKSSTVSRGVPAPGRHRDGRRAAAAAAAAAAALVLAGCTAAPADDGGDGDVDGGADQASGGVPAVRTAERAASVSDVHRETGMTLLEGPVLAAGGELYVTDVAAPAGEPKLLRVDRESGQSREVYTDDASALTSAQFSPADGRLYLTDFAGGRILSLPADGTGPAEVFFSGEVEGKVMRPDDIAFDARGNLFVTDSSGFSDPYWEASGRVVRIDGETGQATVLAEGLPAPNGIAFTPDGSRLWVTHNTGNRVDLFTLNGDGTAVVTAHPAIHVSAGAAQVDSAAVDSAGNLYLGVHNRPAVLVYSELGEQLAVIKAPEEGLSSATNLVIEPGGRQGWMTVSGGSGGFVYSFEALADGLQLPDGG